jgi:hypothetical protein
VGDDTIHGSSCSVMIKVSEFDTRAGFRNSDWKESLKDRGRFRRVELDIEDWDEMGRPEEITVTIEPGDLLNLESKSGN